MNFPKAKDKELAEQMNSPVRHLTRNQLVAERQRLEQLLADGELNTSRAGAVRLVRVRESLAALDAIVQDGAPEITPRDAAADDALYSCAIRNGFMPDPAILAKSSLEWMQAQENAAKAKADYAAQTYGEK